MKITYENVAKLRYIKSQFYIAIDEENLTKAANILNSLSKFWKDEIVMSFNDRYLDMNPIIFNAIEKKNIELIKFLLKNGASLEVFDDAGLTPIQVAIIYIRYHDTKEYEVMMRLLLSQNFDVNIIDPEERTGGETILHTASKVGYLPTVITLLNKGAKINVVDQYGDTPLHESSYQNDIGLVRFFIINGADITIKNESGLTAYDIAKRKGYVQITKDLELAIDIEKIFYEGQDALNINKYYESDEKWFIEVFNYRLLNMFKSSADFSYIQNLTKVVWHNLKNSDLSYDNLKNIIDINEILQHVYMYSDMFIKSEVLPLQYQTFLIIFNNFLNDSKYNLHSLPDYLLTMLKKEIIIRCNLWDDHLENIELEQDKLVLIGEN